MSAHCDSDGDSDGDLSWVEGVPGGYDKMGDGELINAIRTRISFLEGAGEDVSRLAYLCEEDGSQPLRVSLEYQYTRLAQIYARYKARVAAVK